MKKVKICYFISGDIMIKDKDVYIVKVLIREIHDKNNDFVSRPFVRAFRQIKGDGFKRFINSDSVILYCCLENGTLYDIFTQRKIEADDFDYEIIPSSQLAETIKGLEQDEIVKVHTLIRKYIFGDNVKIDFVNVCEMEDLASDRAVMFKEYNEGLSLINPYEKGHENDYNKSLNERLIIEKERRDLIKNAKRHR